jgi:hypothetical protein
MSDRINVTEEQAIAIATAQYDLAAKIFRSADKPPLAMEDVYVRNRAREIMKNGAYPGELKLIET